MLGSARRGAAVRPTLVAPVQKPRAARVLAPAVRPACLAPASQRTPLLSCVGFRSHAVPLLSHSAGLERGSVLLAVRKLQVMCQSSSATTTVPPATPQPPQPPATPQPRQPWRWKRWVAASVTLGCLTTLLLYNFPALAERVRVVTQSAVFLTGLFVTILSLLPAHFSWLNYRDSQSTMRYEAAAAERKANTALLAERDAAAAEQRKTNAALPAERDAAAAAERKANAALLAERDAAAAAERKANAALLAVRAAAAADKADMDRLRELVLDGTMVQAHKMRSLTAGLMRVRGGITPPPAISWSAAEVGVWFAKSKRWPQYQSNFAAYNGEALLSIVREEQLAEAGVLPVHRADLLAELTTLV